jgi:hypothetical protein
MKDIEHRAVASRLKGLQEAVEGTSHGASARMARRLRIKQARWHRFMYPEISPLPVALLESRRRTQWDSPSATNTMEAGEAESFIKLITPSLNRGFAVILSAGFTRAISICGKVALLGVVSLGGNSSAFVASDHAAAIPPNRPMKLRRFSSGRDADFIARPPHRTVRAAFPHTAPTSGV